VSGERKRVLVVDDEPLLVGMVARVLGRDHDVTALGSAREALRRVLAGERYDLLLCDLSMPGMNGVELYEELRRAAPEQAAAMAFMSGGAFRDDLEAFLDRVPNRRLEKPFSNAELLALLDDA
jgi:two-component system NtrC family sensor kinase